MAENEDIKRAERRLARARADRGRHEARLNDIYRLVMPWRRRFSDSGRGMASWEAADDEIFDSTAAVALSDFAADVSNTFTPVYAAWIGVAPVRRLDGRQYRAIEQPLRDYMEIVLSEIRRSNFHAEAHECYRDLGPGTMAMDIVDPDPAGPIVCQAVPTSELAIDRGLYGVVDGRFRELRLPGRDIPHIYGDDALDADALRQLDTDPEREWSIVEAYWRDWSDRGDETWRQLIWCASGLRGSRTGQKLVLADRTLRGAGACPRVVARWETDPDTAWGIGPLYSALADIKTVNKLNELILATLDRRLDPPFFYDDDGVTNLDQGIAPGTAIPRQPGSKHDILESRNNFDPAWFEQDRLQSAIRRALYQDKPLQRGKTPPTATQWLEEALEITRRLGSPSARLVVEWQFAVFRRFAFLLAERGVLPEIRLNGEDVALQPVSPLAQAQKQESALRIGRFVEMVRMGTPEAAAMLVDPVKHAEELRKAWDVPDILNDPEQIRQGIEGAAQAAQAAGMMPGGGQAR